MKNKQWTGNHIRVARKVLDIDQTQLAYMLGWTSKQNVSDLERGYKGKTPTVQTALSVECLLRQLNLWEQFSREIKKY